MKKRKIDGILERLRDIANTQKDVEMCEKLGISYGTLDNWKVRDSIPTKRLKQIAKDNNVSYDWLENGADDIKIIRKSIRDIVGTHMNIPYYPDIYGSAGGGAVINEFANSTFISLEAHFCDLYFKANIHKGLHIINVIGNSMYPTLDDGDMVFVNPLRFGEDVVDGKIYVCIYENEVFIKRINKNPISKTVTLLSDNLSYKGIELTKDETEQLSIIGMVIGSMGRV